MENIPGWLLFYLFFPNIVQKYFKIYILINAIKAL